MLKILYFWFHLLLDSSFSNALVASVNRSNSESFKL